LYVTISTLVTPMSHIVFKIYPSSSHYNSSYGLASHLRTKGHKVTFVGVDQFSMEVTTQGFNYYKIVNDPIQVPVKLKKGFFSGFKRILNRNIALKKSIAKNTSQPWDNWVQKIRPDFMLVDAPYVDVVLDLIKYNLPFFIIHTMVSVDKTKLSPLLNSGLIPANNLHSQFLIELSWKVYFCKRAIINRLQKVLFGISSNQEIIKAFAERNNFPLSKIDYQRFYHNGIKCIPELILSPFVFDFPKLKKDNQFYIYLRPYERKEVNWDYLFRGLTVRIESERALGLFKPIIFCALGSLNHLYSRRISFFKRLINVFRNKSSFYLILALGDSTRLEIFDPLPDNIFIFHSVPQSQLLKKTELMITHGGHNSIMECINNGVPMLVYPCNQVDQPGNAARVVYHRLGERGNIKNDSEPIISKKIDRILNNPFYKENISNFRAKIYHDKSYKAKEILKKLETIMKI